MTEQSARTAEQVSQLWPHPVTETYQHTGCGTHQLLDPLPDVARGGQQGEQLRPQAASLPTTGAANGASAARRVGRSAGTVLLLGLLQGRQSQVLVGTEVIRQQGMSHAAANAAQTPDADALATEVAFVPSMARE